MSRNIVKYPITMEEVIKAMDLVVMQYDDDDRVGDQNAFILHRILKLLPERFNEEDFK